MYVPGDSLPAEPLFAFAFVHMSWVSSMPRKSDDSVSALLPKVPLLPTESARDFETVRKALMEEIKPQGIIEQLYVADPGHRVEVNDEVGRGSGADIPGPKRLVCAVA